MYEKMRKYMIFLYCLGMLLLSGCSSKTDVQAGVMDCTSSMRVDADNYSSDYITVVLNVDVITDSEQVAKEIIEKYSGNGFRTIRWFSLPDMLTVTAYLKRNDVKPVLQFDYDFATRKYKMKSEY